MLAFVVAATVGVVISAQVSSGHSIPVFGWSLLPRLGVWAVAWVVAVVTAMRLPRRVAVVLVLFAALGLRLAALGGGPTTSDDLYRYTWDGRVQAAGLDPYVGAPTASVLMPLREPWLWPSARGCAELRRAPGCTRINRAAERTVYPPGAQAWFGAVYRLAGVGARYKAWQVAGLIVDLATIGLILVALRRWGHDARWVALYALCPAPVLEFVNNGHVDGLAVALIVAAFVVVIPPAIRPARPTAVPPARPAAGRLTPAGRDIAFGLLIGAAALIKLYPAVLLVPVLALPRLRPWRSFVRASASAAALAVAGYVPHILAVGPRVLGYLPGYLREEHYGGGRFLLAGVVGLSGWVATAVAVAILVAVCGWVSWRRPAAPSAAVVVLAALFLVATPVQPWYAVSLVAVCSMAGWPWPAVVAVAAYPYYFAVILASRDSLGEGQLAYGMALVVAIAASLLGTTGGRRWERRGAGSAGSALLPGVSLASLESSK